MSKKQKQPPRYTFTHRPSTKPTTPLKQKLWEIVFEAETTAGKAFDITILITIITSVAVVMLDSIPHIHDEYTTPLLIAEWIFTLIFTAEYLLRIWLVRKPLRYIFSFYGLVDLLSCLPGYITLIIDGKSHFAIIRLLRILRMFRVLKMVSHVRGADIILRGLHASRAKITVFFTAVLILATLAGALIYTVEGTRPNTPFTDIPTSIYYAIVSITTVGYGDITAITPMGKLITALMVLTGYAIIAVPTGIVAGDMVKEILAQKDETSDACPGCGAHGHLHDAIYCRKCGEHLSQETTQEPS